MPQTFVTALPEAVHPEKIAPEPPSHKGIGVQAADAAVPTSHLQPSESEVDDDDDDPFSAYVPRSERSYLSAALQTHEDDIQDENNYDQFDLGNSSTSDSYDFPAGVPAPRTPSAAYRAEYGTRPSKWRQPYPTAQSVTLPAVQSFASQVDFDDDPFASGSIAADTPRPALQAPDWLHNAPLMVNFSAPVPTAPYRGVQATTSDVTSEDSDPYAHYISPAMQADIALAVAYELAHSQKPTEAGIVWSSSGALKAASCLPLVTIVGQLQESTGWPAPRTSSADASSEPCGASRMAPAEAPMADPQLASADSGSAGSEPVATGDDPAVVDSELHTEEPSGKPPCGPSAMEGVPLQDVVQGPANGTTRVAKDADKSEMSDERRSGGLCDAASSSGSGSGSEGGAEQGDQALVMGREEQAAWPRRPSAGSSGGKLPGQADSPDLGQADDGNLADDGDLDEANDGHLGQADDLGLGQFNESGMGQADDPDWVQADDEPGQARAARQESDRRLSDLYGEAASGQAVPGAAAPYKESAKGESEEILAVALAVAMSVVVEAVDKMPGPVAEGVRGESESGEELYKRPLRGMAVATAGQSVAPSLGALSRVQDSSSVRQVAEAAGGEVKGDVVRKRADRKKALSAGEAEAENVRVMDIDGTAVSTWQAAAAAQKGSGVNEGPAAGAEKPSLTPPSCNTQALSMLTAPLPTELSAITSITGMGAADFGVCSVVAEAPQARGALSCSPAVGQLEQRQRQEVSQMEQGRRGTLSGGQSGAETVPLDVFASSAAGSLAAAAAATATAAEVYVSNGHGAVPDATLDGAEDTSYAISESAPADVHNSLPTRSNEPQSDRISLEAEGSLTGRRPAVAAPLAQATAAKVDELPLSVGSACAAVKVLRRSGPVPGQLEVPQPMDRKEADIRPPSRWSTDEVEEPPHATATAAVTGRQRVGNAAGGCGGTSSCTAPRARPGSPPHATGRVAEPDPVAGARGGPPINNGTCRSTGYEHRTPEPGGAFRTSDIRQSPPEEVASNALAVTPASSSCCLPPRDNPIKTSGAQMAAATPFVAASGLAEEQPAPRRAASPALVPAVAGPGRPRRFSAAGGRLAVTFGATQFERSPIGGPPIGAAMSPAEPHITMRLEQPQQPQQQQYCWPQPQPQPASVNELAYMHQPRVIMPAPPTSPRTRCSTARGTARGARGVTAAAIRGCSGSGDGSGSARSNITVISPGSEDYLACPESWLAHLSPEEQSDAGAPQPSTSSMGAPVHAGNYPVIKSYPPGPHATHRALSPDVGPGPNRYQADVISSQQRPRVQSAGPAMPGGRRFSALGMSLRPPAGPPPGIPLLSDLARRYPIRVAPNSGPQVALVSGQLYVSDRLREALMHGRSAVLRPRVRDSEQGGGGGGPPWATPAPPLVALRAGRIPPVGTYLQQRQAEKAQRALRMDQRRLRQEQQYQHQPQHQSQHQQHQQNQQHQQQHQQNQHQQNQHQQSQQAQNKHDQQQQQNALPRRRVSALEDAGVDCSTQAPTTEVGLPRPVAVKAAWTAAGPKSDSVQECDPQSTGAAPAHVAELRMEVLEAHGRQGGGDPVAERMAQARARRDSVERWLASNSGAPMDKVAADRRPALRASRMSDIN